MELIFGFGSIQIVLGSSGGAPCLGFKKINFGLKTGEEIPKNISTAAIEPEMVLRFFNKESLLILKGAVDRLVEKYKELEKPEKQIVFWVQVISDDGIKVFQCCDPQEVKS